MAERAGKRFRSASVKTRGLSTSRGSAVSTGRGRFGDAGVVALEVESASDDAVQILVRRS